jgi:hemolysin activation/secretion protein
VADGRFLAWLGQANWIYRAESLGMEFLSGVNMQFANDRLFPLEQFSVGGRYSVRGYRENQLVRDNAFTASFETRIALWPSMLGADRVQLAPFVDVGRSWNTGGGNPDPMTLASIGSGLRINPDPRAHFEVYWGHRLNKVDIPPPGGNLQDHGVHFQMILNLL